MDVFTKEKRSKIMSHVNSKDTKPELIVRSLLHNMKYRFRIHRKDLPGKPDIVLPKHKKVIFVHGCFWHSHKACPRAKRPATNVAFWQEKLEKNIERDKRSISELKELGWDVLVVWTCEVDHSEYLKKTLIAFLGNKESLGR